MTATYFILLDLKSRNKSIRLLANRRQEPTAIPSTLLREKNQEIFLRSRLTHEHPPPADLLLISQQSRAPVTKTTAPKLIVPGKNECRDRSAKTPNKENIDNTRTRRQDPTMPHCQRTLMFAESPGGTTRNSDKKAGQIR